MKNAYIAAHLAKILEVALRLKVAVLVVGPKWWQTNYSKKTNAFIFIYTSCVYTENGYTIKVIRSFADKETEKIYRQEFSKKLPRLFKKSP